MAQRALGPASPSSRTRSVRSGCRPGARPSVAPRSPSTRTASGSPTAPSPAATWPWTRACGTSWPSAAAHPEAALHAASTAPAALLGDTIRGTLALGARADLVLLTEDLELVATVVGGEVLHDARGA